jgi:hypothetical protein
MSFSRVSLVLCFVFLLLGATSVAARVLPGSKDEKDNGYRRSEGLRPGAGQHPAAGWLARRRGCTVPALISCKLQQSAASSSAAAAQVDHKRAPVHAVAVVRDPDCPPARFLPHPFRPKTNRALHDQALVCHWARNLARHLRQHTRWQHLRGHVRARAQRHRHPQRDVPGR